MNRPFFEGCILRQNSFIAIAVVLALVSSASALDTAPLRYAVPSQSGAFIPYAASHSLTERNSRITRLLFSIHSSGFDAIQYYENARQAASRVRGALEQTLIVAPQLYQQDVIPGPIPDGLLYWRSSPYRGSARSAVGPEKEAVSLSAFTVIDEWLEHLIGSGNFPRLKEVVLVGHSAGGQFVQRYAMVGRFRHDSIRFRYVVSAPSSYAYPVPERFDASKRRFLVPDAGSVRRCRVYNHWGYGLEEPYRYFSDVDPQVIADAYAMKRVFYLCGERDNDPNDRSIGKSCGAMLQGAHRLERMLLFKSLLDFKYGDQVKRFHRFAVVPKVGHHGLGTMTSSAGIQALFGQLP